MSKHFIPLRMEAPAGISHILTADDGQCANHIIGASSVSMKSEEEGKSWRVGVVFVADREAAHDRVMPEQVIPVLLEMFKTSLDGLFGPEAVERAQEQMGRELQRKEMATFLRSLGLTVVVH